MKDCVTWSLLLTICSGAPTRISDPGNHIATGSQLVIRNGDGTIKTGVDTGDSFRAETRMPDGSSKGVYGWISVDGSPVTVAFSSDSFTGHQVVPKVEDLAVNLPAFPYSLYGKPKTYLTPILAEQRMRVEDDDIIILNALNAKDKVIKDEDEVEDDVEFVGEGDDEGEEENVRPLLMIKPGTPVAQSSPSATAIAGMFGVAHVAPGSTAIVGPGGVAIAFPTGQAIVGPGGVAISSPVSTSQAGTGGIAIAGGQSTAVSGVIQSGEISSQNSEDDVGFLTAKKSESATKTPVTSFAAYPVIANYFFGVQPQYYGAAAGFRVPARRPSFYVIPPQQQQQRQQPQQQQYLYRPVPNFGSPMPYYSTFLVHKEQYYEAPNFRAFKNSMDSSS